MLMDFRCGQRQSVEWDALILVADGVPLRGRIRDFSSGGLFIELPPHTLNVHTRVDVSAIIGGTTKLKVELWSAWVVHRSQTGVGLRFSEPIPFDAHYSNDAATNSTPAASVRSSLV
jgi:hypothetical protein